MPAERAVRLCLCVWARVLVCVRWELKQGGSYGGSRGEPDDNRQADYGCGIWGLCTGGWWRVHPLRQLVASPDAQVFSERPRRADRHFQRREKPSGWDPFSPLCQIFDIPFATFGQKTVCVASIVLECRDLICCNKSWTCETLHPALLWIIMLKKKKNVGLAVGLFPIYSTDCKLNCDVFFLLRVFKDQMLYFHTIRERMAVLVFQCRLFQTH